jgi:hypothetical protein
MVSHRSVSHDLTTEESGTEINPSQLIELKRLDVSQSRFHEILYSVRVFCICATVVLSIGMICWSVVRIVEKPAWWELALAVTGALVGPAGFFRWWVKRSNRNREKFLSQLREQTQEVEGE